MPLAIANAATTSGLLFTLDPHGNVEAPAFLLGAVLGASVGAIFWIPALIATLVAFGLPIAWSQKLAQKGLAGEERGERVVGTFSALIALVGLLVLLTTPTEVHDVYRQARVNAAMTSLDAVGKPIVAILAVLGLVSGSIAAMLAHGRENRRRAFVREVEAGEVNGYRVDATNEGKVLVRINPMGEGYRVANFEEPIFDLDESGEARQSMALGRSGSVRD